MTNPPCKDCICLAICRSEYHSLYHEEGKKQHAAFNIRRLLQKKCPILDAHFNYMAIVYIETKEERRIETFHNFMQKALP